MNIQAFLPSSSNFANVKKKQSQQASLTSASCYFMQAHNRMERQLHHQENHQSTSRRRHFMVFMPIIVSCQLPQFLVRLKVHSCSQVKIKQLSQAPDTINSKAASTPSLLQKQLLSFPCKEAPFLDAEQTLQQDLNFEEYTLSQYRQVHPKTRQ
ncbi:hypothetical protein L7F22_001449 [Adiantum nelumboides]|nr:hypothetical protein [Adiantum nelumboides]